MLKHCNGWQRLWVVFTALCLVPVTIFAIDSFPTAGKYSNRRVLDTIEFAGQQMELQKPGYTFEGSYTVLQKHYGNLDDEQIIERLHTKFKDKVDFSRIDLEYYRKLDQLRLEQAKVVGYALLWWVIPSAALYLFGLAIAWVVGGFRSNRS